LQACPFGLKWFVLPFMPRLVAAFFPKQHAPLLSGSSRRSCPLFFAASMFSHYQPTTSRRFFPEPHDVGSRVTLAVCLKGPLRFSSARRAGFVPQGLFFLFFFSPPDVPSPPDLSLHCRKFRMFARPWWLELDDGPVADTNDVFSLIGDAFS